MRAGLDSDIYCDAELSPTTAWTEARVFFYDNAYVVLAQADVRPGAARLDHSKLYEPRYLPLTIYRACFNPL